MWASADNFLQADASDCPTDLLLATPAATPEPDNPTFVDPLAPSLAVRLATCTDVAPGSRHTCAEQKGFGKCDAEYMVK